MKMINFKIFFSALIIIVSVASCVQNDDFTIPSLDNKEPSITGIKITVDEVLGQIAQSNGQMFTYDGTNNYMEGYVVSSDKSGNFFNELIVQDRAENPNAGIRVLIDVNPLYTSYEFGRKIYIQLDGLSVGTENGVASLGILSGSRIGQIPSFSQSKFIKRSTEVATIIPLEVVFEEFSEDITSLYIKVTNVQFNKNDVLGTDPSSFAGEPSDEFDGERTLESCDTGARTIVSTSTFADFKSLRLPSQKGSLEGVLTKNFVGDTFNLVLNDPSGLFFDSEERCDREEIACGLTSVIGNTNLFSDDFETQNTNNLISGNGWKNYIQEGTEGWEAFSSTGTNASIGISAKVSSFGSDDARTIAWLISPQINLDEQDGETLRFLTSTSFSDSSELDVLYSKDWNGIEANIMDATWGVFVDATIVQNDDFFGDWINSGTIDLSCERGIIYIAFRYRGNDVNDDFNGTYELDEISVDAN